MFQRLGLDHFMMAESIYIGGSHMPERTNAVAIHLCMNQRRTSSPMQFRLYGPDEKPVLLLDIVLHEDGVELFVLSRIRRASTNCGNEALADV